MSKRHRPKSVGCPRRTLGMLGFTKVQTKLRGLSQFKENDSMAFVNESIPDEDKQRIDFGQLRNPVNGHPLPLPPYQWTVDHERDIALISLGGGGESSDFPNFFVLYWQGRFINVHLRYTTTGDFPTNDLEVTWRLEFLGNLGNIPEQEVIAALQEALIEKKYGPWQFRDKVKAVHFAFDDKHRTVR